MSPLTRMRKNLGISKFEEFKPNGEPNEDYAEPFTGLSKRVKQTFAAYLMKLVSFMHSRDNVLSVVKRSVVF